MLVRAPRDYYAVLGVPPDAGAQAIKRAFRALAHSLHPDVSDDPSAAARFREVAEAYQVLSDAAARARYDRLRTARASAARRSQAPRTVRDPVSGMPGSRPGQPGTDVRAELPVTFREAAQGGSRQLAYSALDACRRCLGTGRAVSAPCGACGGTGRVEVERAVAVRVPPGALDGHVLRIRGEGNPGGQGAPPGDLVITLRVAPLPESTVVRVLAAAGVVCAAALAALLLLH